MYLCIKNEYTKAEIQPKKSQLNFQFEISAISLYEKLGKKSQLKIISMKRVINI